MGQFTQLPIVTVAMPLSGAQGAAAIQKAHELPSVAEINTLQTEVDALIVGQTGGVIVFATYALLDAYTPTTADQEVSSFKVTNDADSALNGYYAWTSGTTYTKDADLVVNVIEEANTSDAVSGKAVVDYTLENTRDIDSAEKQLNRINDAESYRDSDGFIYSIKDLYGKVALYIDSEARVGVDSLVMSASTTTTGREENSDSMYSIYSIKDLYGKVALYIDSEARVGVDSLVMSASTTTTGREENSIFKFSLSDNNGRSVFGITEDGKVSFIPDTTTLNAIVGGISYVEPTVSNLPGAFNIRNSNLLKVSTIQETDKTTFDVREKDGLIPLVESPDAVEIILFSGQSNAGGSGASVSEYSGGKKFPYSVTTYESLGASGSSYGNSVLLPANLVNITQLQDYPVGVLNQYPGTMTAFAIENRIRDSKKPHGIFTATTWFGGNPLSTFVRGTDQWNALMEMADNAGPALSNYNKGSYCSAYVFIQGESGSAGYRSDLLAYINDVIPEIKLKTGQASDPEFFLLQISSPSNTAPGGENGVDLAQFLVTQDKLGLGSTTATPMYQFPLSDNIHVSALGRMAMGEVIAEVHNTVVTNNVTFQPLMPSTVTRSGAVVTIVFDVPAGDIEFDLDGVEPAINFGFEYVDDTLTASISSVIIVSSDTLEITLDQTPTGSNPKIKYAQAQNIVAGWSATRGQLRSPTKVKSFYFEQGYDVPEIVNHYCLRFSETIT